MNALNSSEDSPFDIERKKECKKLSHGTRIQTRANGTRIITLCSAERYLTIEEEAREEFGKTLFEAAEENPTRAYDYLRQVIGTTASRHTLDIVVDQAMVSHSDIDGLQETRSRAEEVVFEYLPGSYEGALNVTVQVPADEMDVAFGLPENTVVLQLAVTPDNYAA